MESKIVKLHFLWCHGFVCVHVTMHVLFEVFLVTDDIGVSKAGGLLDLMGAMSTVSIGLWYK